MVKGVHIQVHPLFFDRVFETNRKKMQKKLKKYNLTQIDFTKLLVDYNAQIKIPKQSRRRK